jgi:hypothetical protein
MQDKATGSRPAIALSAAAVVLLRSAAYTRLERDCEAVDHALLLSPDRAVDRKVWAAFMRLMRTGALLDRAGWTYEQQRGEVKLDCQEDVHLALAVLRDDLATEGNVKAAAISDGSEAAAMAASRRELAIYDTLTGLEALAATEGLRFRDQHATA